MLLIVLVSTVTATQASTYLCTYVVHPLTQLQWPNFLLSFSSKKIEIEKPFSFQRLQFPPCDKFTSSSFKSNRTLVFCLHFVESNIIWTCHLHHRATRDVKILMYIYSYTPTKYKCNTFIADALSEMLITIHFYITRVFVWIYNSQSDFHDDKYMYWRLVIAYFCEGYTHVQLCNNRIHTHTIEYGRQNK